MTVHEGLNVGPDFLLRDVPQADRDSEATVIGTGLVGTGFTFEELRGGMKRGEPLGELSARQRESGDPAKRGEMAGTGVVADENGGAINERKQIGDGSRRDDTVFACFKPPFALVRVAGDLNAVVGLAQTSDELAKAVQWPDANRLAGAGVDEDFAVGTRCSQFEFFVRGQGETERASHHAPVLIMMSRRIWPRENLGEKHPAAHPWKAKAR